MPTPTDRTLTALYVMNKVAKQYAGSAAEAYEAGEKAVGRAGQEMKAHASQQSVRKQTLYRYKTAILQTLYREGHVDCVERHTIDGADYYCLYIDEWSFHTPVEQWSQAGIDADVEETKALTDFSPGAAIDEDDTHDENGIEMDERDALQHLAEVFESPNEYLPYPFVDYEYGSEFAGWSSLPGAISEGAPIPEDEYLARDHGEPFLFAVGDAFETVEEGPVEIIDRYGMWLEPRFDRGSVRPRPAYDVDIEGDRRDGVRQERIHDDWKVRIRDLGNPGSHIDGALSDAVGSHFDEDPGFREGDTVVVASEWLDEPVEYRIDAMWASHSLVMVDLAPVDDDDFAETLSVEEFADDIVERRAADGE